MMPPLPKPVLSLPAAAYKIEYQEQPLCPLFTEAQMLEYGRQCIEAAAALCDRFAERGMHPAECAGAIRAMLKEGETE